MTKNIFLLLCVLIGLSGYGQPRGANTPQLRAKQSVNMLKRDLNLSEDQTGKLMNIYIAHNQAIDSLMEASNRNKEDINVFKTKFRVKKVLLEKKVMSILDDQQKIVYANHIASGKEVTLKENPTPLPSSTH